MIWLLIGLALWTGLHLFTTVFRPTRGRIVARIGEGAWKGIVALGLVLSIWSMARGYGATSAGTLWIAPEWLRHLAVAAMLPVFILYMGTIPGSALAARVRHPQLTAFKLWAVLHLVANGDVRSLVLFGGLLAWAVAQLVLLNRRDGKPPLPRPAASSLRAWAFVPAGFVIWAVLLWAHPWLFGVHPLG